MLFGKYVNKFYKKYFWHFFFGVVFLVFVDVIQLMLPDLVGGMTESYDAGILTVEEIRRSCFYILLIGVGTFLGRFLWRISILSEAYHIAADLRGEMFDRSLLFSQNYFHKNKVGGIMTYFTNDIDTIQESFGWGIVMLVDAVFLSALTFYKMAVTNWILTAICALPLLVLCFASYFIDRKMEKIYNERQNVFERMSDYAQEMFTGLRVIKAFVREVREARRFRQVNEHNREKDLNLVKFSALLDTVISILIEGMIVIGMAAGGYLVFRTFEGTARMSLTRDQMVKFIMYFDTIIWPMLAMGQIVALLSRAKTSLKRVSSFLDTPVEIYDDETCRELSHISGTIEFRKFSYAYPNQKEVLRGIDLTIHAGENIGIIGKIGSGKSTLVNCLLRMDNLRKGTLFIDGRDIMSLPVKQVRDAIAYVPQDNFLFSTTVRNNIGFADESLSEEQIVEAAEFADVHGNIVDFVEGYRTLIGERGVTLSGGQKQRISIARAYVKHAPIMILDDAVSAVDVKTEEKILENIRVKRKGKTTILIASRVSTVQHLDRVIVLNDGQVEAFDTPERLMEISPTYQKMVRLQELENEQKGGEF